MDDNNVVEQPNDDVKAKMEEALEKIRTQNLLLGARAMCKVIADMIDIDERRPGKRSMNDMKRILKKVRDFCQKAIDNEVETPKFGDEDDDTREDENNET